MNAAIISTAINSTFEMLAQESKILKHLIYKAKTERENGQMKLTREQELKLYGAAVNREHPYTFIEGAATILEILSGDTSDFFNAAMEAYSTSGQPSGSEWLRVFGKWYFNNEKKKDGFKFIQATTNGKTAEEKK
jgi:hypothetical protein